MSAMSVGLPAHVIVDADVMVPMRDGIRLCTQVYRPSESERYPTLLMRTPYELEYTGVVLPEFATAAVEAGYAFVVQHCRGRFGSEGSFMPHHPDVTDGYDAVEWAASQEWSNGRVGMVGVSYGGLAQWCAARARPPHLVAIAPESASWRFVGSAAWHYSPGVMSTGMALFWTVMMLAEEARRKGVPHPYPNLARAFDDMRTSTDIESAVAASFRVGTELQPLLAYRPLRDLPGFAELAPWWRDWCDHPDPNDPYWRDIQAGDMAEPFDLPALHKSGWYDYYPSGVIDAFTALTDGAPSGHRLVVGPWTHIGVPPPREDLLPLLSATLPWVDPAVDGALMEFLDEQVKQIGSSPAVRAPISLFVMGENAWREEWEWPLARTAWIRYYLSSSGKAGADEQDGKLSLVVPSSGSPDAYRYNPDDPVIAQNTIGLGGLGIVAYGSFPFDQQPIEARDDVLVYSTEPLTEPVEVTGPVVAELWVSTSAPDTDFTAKLVDVQPDGRAWPVCQGITRLSYSEESPALSTQNDPVRIHIRLWPTSTVFQVGHRIRLEVSSSEWPTWELNPNTGDRITHDSKMQIADQKIFHEGEFPSHVLLPIIPRQRP